MIYEGMGTVLVNGFVANGVFVVWTGIYSGTQHQTLSQLQRLLCNIDTCKLMCRYHLPISLTIRKYECGYMTEILIKGQRTSLTNLLLLQVIILSDFVFLQLKTNLVTQHFPFGTNHPICQ